MKENRRAAVTCGLMTLMLFAALAVYMRARLEYAGTWGQTLSLAALFTLVAGGAMALVARLQKPERGALLLSCLDETGYAARLLELSTGELKGPFHGPSAQGYAAGPGIRRRITTLF